MGKSRSRSAVGETSFQNQAEAPQERQRWRAARTRAGRPPCGRGSGAHRREFQATHYRDRAGSRCSPEAARSWSSGQKRSLPRRGGVPEGEPRAGLSSALPGCGRRSPSVPEPPEPEMHVRGTGEMWVELQEPGGQDGARGGETTGPPSGKRREGKAARHSAPGAPLSLACRAEWVWGFAALVHGWVSLGSCVHMSLLGCG